MNDDKGKENEMRNEGKDRLAAGDTRSRINDRFENEVVKREEWNKERKKEKKIKFKKRLHSIYSPQNWPGGGSGTSALYLFWHKPLHIIILMNIYLYIYFWICFARRGPVWVGWPATGPSGCPQVSSEEPDRVQKLSALWKQVQEYFSGP